LPQLLASRTLPPLYAAPPPAGSCTTHLPSQAWTGTPASHASSPVSLPLRLLRYVASNECHPFSAPPVAAPHDQGPADIPVTSDHKKQAIETSKHSITTAHPSNPRTQDPRPVLAPRPIQNQRQSWDSRMYSTKRPEGRRAVHTPAGWLGWAALPARAGARVAVARRLSSVRQGAKPPRRLASLRSSTHTCCTQN
jgi:hypothetical protein